jgi:AcrR family transcriptional regulator
MDMREVWQVPRGPETVPVRAALSRDRIIGAAIEVIEREGEAALSMRRIATELGVAVMSLYNHVSNKAALLDGVAERILAGMEVGDDAPAGVRPRPLAEREHWTARARALIRAYRKVAHDYPRCVTLVLTRKIDAPSGMRPVEHALALAADAGFDGETSVRIMRALLAYAIGAQMREVGAAKLLDYLPNKTAERFDRLDPGQFPHVVSFQDELLSHDPETDFEFGLDLMLSALDQLPRRGGRGTG